MNQTEWEDWKLHPATRMFFQWLKDLRYELTEELCRIPAWTSFEMSKQTFSDLTLKSKISLLDDLMSMTADDI